MQSYILQHSLSSHWSGTAGTAQLSALKCLKGFKILYHLRLDFFFFLRVAGIWLLKLIFSCAHFILIHTPSHFIPIPLPPILQICDCRCPVSHNAMDCNRLHGQNSEHVENRRWRYRSWWILNGELFWLAPPNAQSLLFLKQIVNTGSKLRSHLEHQSLPKECFGSYPAAEAPIACVLLSGFSALRRNCDWCLLVQQGKLSQILKELLLLRWIHFFIK